MSQQTASVPIPTAGELATFVNTICAVEEKQPGIVAKDPLWAYNLGVQMFGV